MVFLVLDVIELYFIVRDIIENKGFDVFRCFREKVDELEVFVFVWIYDFYILKKWVYFEKNSFLVI